MTLLDKAVTPKVKEFKSFSQMPIESITAEERKTVAVPKLGALILIAVFYIHYLIPEKSQC